MPRRTSKLVVLALIENDRGDILLSRRWDPDFPDAHLRWDLPGGTNEWGESLERTAERETLEETGLLVEAAKMLGESVSKTWVGADTQQHTVVLCYRCRLVGGTLATNDPKIAKLRWVSPADLGDYEFLPTTARFLSGV